MVFFVSLRSAKILVLFLLPPLVLSLLWFSLPLNTPAGFYIAMLLYFFWYFFACWISLSVGCLSGLYVSQAISNKWFITVSLGIAEFICSTGCYLFHIRNVRMLITRRNETLSMAVKKGLNLDCPAPRLHRHFTKPLYTSLCYWNGLDDVIEDQETAAQLEQATSHSLGQSVANPSASEGIQVAIMLPYEQWSASTMIWALVFKLLMTVVWYFLQGFIELNRVLVSNQSGSIISLAVVSIVIFQIFRAIFINLLIAVNAKLPASLESAYFAPFALQAMFFFYYRNLFLTFQNWGATVALNFVVFFFQVLIYPVYMTKTLYNFRFKFLKNVFSNRLPFLSFLLPFVDGDEISHDRHIKDLAVEYYYDQVITDIGLRFATQKLLHINIASIARNSTIYNYRARFLFTTFLLFFLTDVYYSLMQTDSWTTYFATHK